MRVMTSSRFLWISSCLFILLYTRSTAGQASNKVTISATATLNGQRYMPADTVLATVTITGGALPLTFADPVNDRFFKILHLKTAPGFVGNQAWIFNRVPFGLGTYTVPVTATDSKGETGTQLNEITIV